MVTRALSERLAPTPLPAAALRAAPLVALLAAALAALSPASASADAPLPGNKVVYLPHASVRWSLYQLPPVRFSAPHGRYAEPFWLELSTADGGVTIRYTLDGSAPTATHGLVYGGPIRVDRTLVVRAAAFHPGRRPAPVASRTYLFLEQVLRQPALPPGFPAFWGRYPEGQDAGDRIPADYAMDPRVVDDPRYRGRILNDLASLPSLSLAMDPADLFGTEAVKGIYSHPLEQGGSWVDPATGETIRPWERAASVEWIPPGDAPGFQIDAGARIAGGWSRKPDGTAKHSFALRFRQQYGAGKLRYPLFEGADGRPGPASFDGLRLRAGQADSFHYFGRKAQYAYDEWGRATQRAMGMPSARGTWAHLYLNGLYWGLYDVTEELDDTFMSSRFGGERESWDVIEAESEDPSPLGGWKVEAGRPDAWAELMALRDASLASGRPVDRETYALAAALLDVPAFADYQLLQMLGDNWDWPHNNWVAGRNRFLGGGFRLFVWDFEHVLPLRRDPRSGLCGPCNPNSQPRTCGLRRCGERLESQGVQGLHAWLSGSEEYRFAFADRVRAHLFEGGALTAAALQDRYRAVTESLAPGIVGESARWGDVAFGERTKNENWLFLQDDSGPRRVFTLDDHWRPERERVLRDELALRPSQLLGQLCAVSLYPPVAGLRFSPAGEDRTRAGDFLRIERLPGGCPGEVTAGRIYFTLDGSDPRAPRSADGSGLWTGEVAPTAQLYEGPIALPGRFLQVRARLRSPDGRWGAQAVARFGTPRIAFTELMYHPRENGDAEFLELQSLEADPIDLSGARLVGGVRATLPEGSVLRPGAHLLLVADPEAFASRHPGITPDGSYEGRLANEGEALALVDRAGRTLAALRYDDGDFWPLTPDGLGFSLVPYEPGRAGDDPEAWRASARPGGSPGATDPPPPYGGRVAINEALGHSEAPYEDAIELRNLSTTPGDDVDLGGWYLSDDRDEPRKYRIPDGTVLTAGGYVAFYVRDFGEASAEGPGFRLSAEGESVVLSAYDSYGRLLGYQRRMRYGAADRNVSLGRLRTQGGLEVPPLERPTFGVDEPASVEDFRAGGGAPNAPPRVGPALLNELLPRPPGAQRAFLELRNLSARDLPLGGAPDGTGPWAITEGVTFTFPAGAVLPAGGLALVVDEEPALYRALNDVPPEVPVYGPWEGSLRAEGEAVGLSKPPDGEVADPVDGPWVPVDRLDFLDEPPWRTAALSDGASLQRLDPPGFGNDPGRWIALRRGGTPGRANPPPLRLHLPALFRGR